MFNNTTNYEYNRPDRIIVIGDIHGDLKRFKNILVDAKIINNNLEWIAEPNTFVVQLGDQVDSLNRNLNVKNWEILSDTEMIYFTNNLSMIAKAKNCIFISLIGNHELMNTIGDFSYVSDNSKKETRLSNFQPMGSIAQILAKRPLVIKIGDLFFSHAKFSIDHYNILMKYNKNISYINELWKNYMLKIPFDINDKEIVDDIIVGPNGILWNRHDNNTELTKNVLELIGCNIMFVGHTPMPNIIFIDNQILYCDTGISRSFGTSKYQYIDINKNEINVKTIIEEE